MKTVKTYSTTFDAEIAKMELAAAGISAVVVGLGAELEGGTGGVQLLVPEEYVEAALILLKGS